MIKHLFMGFAVKAITGVDDMMTHIPVITSITRTRRGKVAFSIGIFSAISLAIVFSIFFSSLVRRMPYYKYVLAGVMFVLAGVIYSKRLKERKIKKTEKKIKKIRKSKKISRKRFSKLFLAGFVTSFATVIDDSLAYSPAFIGTLGQKIFGIMGILIAALLQIMILVYFSRKISKIKNRKLISSIGLVIIGILILLGVI